MNPLWSKSVCKYIACDLVFQCGRILDPLLAKTLSASVWCYRLAIFPPNAVITTHGKVYQTLDPTLCCLGLVLTSRLYPTTALWQGAMHNMWWWLSRSPFYWDIPNIPSVNRWYAIGGMGPWKGRIGRCAILGIQLLGVLACTGSTGVWELLMLCLFFSFFAQRTVGGQHKGSVKHSGKLTSACIT